MHNVAEHSWADHVRRVGNEPDLDQGAAITAMTAHMLIRTDGRPFSPSRRAHSQVVRAAVYSGLALVDVVVVFLSFLAADVVRHGHSVDSRSLQYFFIVPVFSAVGFYSRGYTYQAVVSSRRGALQAVISLIVSAALVVLINFALKNSEAVSRIAFFVGCLFSLTALMIVRLALVVKRLGTRFMRRVLVVDGEYEGSVPREFEVIDTQMYGIRPDVSDPIMLHNFSQLVAGADRVVVACPIAHREQWSLYLKRVDCACRNCTRSGRFTPRASWGCSACECPPGRSTCATASSSACST